MKTHAVKENRILKSFDFVLIVLTMSFVSFMLLKSTVPFPVLTKHSVTGKSVNVEFPVLQQKVNAANDKNAVQEIISEKAETNSISKESNAVTAVKGEIGSEAATVEQSPNTKAKSKDTQNAPVIDSQFEKSVLENWIKDRDEWEQK